ncbi:MULTISPECIES: response regulator [Desulfococcus]|jgi:DNA-binding NarL/FixJ family response regulator|uniref:Two component transcriptional regulator, LuxR family n=1 Tax=Desulfococcus multivorans DSM 2059 TaxID=1121405 RepID=S7TWW4_DESML|nr:response regulator transcription factor [Desulfococcus multivorans]AOY58584.1 two component system transcriptional regulator, LuxR family [Desulfococcus multivorans]AQV00889.1 DNA-binding response regulator [Desulfococcus multivorans]EPR41566.1 two component transcriptional regulator, LuxR family [Desulfococcus multivorans DSM 2059]MDX9818808.1 response regulator transcription factor [Desulfococcus multivorans]SJZ43856.1 two component transcriptional regulator, LuxR family [Desulfococcus mu
MEKKRIIIAEDNTLLREGIRLMIESDDALEIAGEAEDGLSAVRCVSKCSHDLVLLDLSMPKMNGIAALKEIKRLSPKTKILALTIHDSEEYILEVFRSGAEGYCLKDSTQEELLRAIHVVLSGKNFISPGIAGKVLEGYIESRKTLKSETPWDTLTQREREVLKLVGEGYTSKEIARFLFISPKTVEKHRSNIMQKLNIHNASALTAYAIEKGLVARN